MARPKGTPRILARRRNDPDGEPDPYTYCAHWRAAEVFSHLDHSPLTGEVEVPVAILTSFVERTAVPDRAWLVVCLAVPSAVRIGWLTSRGSVITSSSKARVFLDEDDADAWIEMIDDRDKRNRLWLAELVPLGVDCRFYEGAHIDAWVRATGNQPLDAHMADVYRSRRYTTGDGDDASVATPLPARQSGQQQRMLASAAKRRREVQGEDMGSKSVSAKSSVSKPKPSKSKPIKPAASPTPPNDSVADAMKRKPQRRVVVANAANTTAATNGNGNDHHSGRHPCLCGCGTLVEGSLARGHYAKLESKLALVASGRGKPEKVLGKQLAKAMGPWVVMKRTGGSKPSVTDYAKIRAAL